MFCKWCKDEGWLVVQCCAVQDSHPTTGTGTGDYYAVELDSHGAWSNVEIDAPEHERVFCDMEKLASSSEANPESLIPEEAEQPEKLEKPEVEPGDYDGSCKGASWNRNQAMIAD